MRFSSILLLTTALLAPATAAHADEADAIVVTATRSEQPLSRIGQSVTVLDAETIRSAQETTVSDLLLTTPGIAVARNGGIGTATTVRIRGAESDQTVALIDGVKLNDPSALGGGYDFANLLVGNIERIEILRGPQSVLWGSQAIGGVVNLITAEPTEDLSVNARAEAGYHDTTQLVGNVSGRAGRVAASVGAGWFRTDGVSAYHTGPSAAERDGYENFGANAKLRIDLSDAVAVDLRGWYADGRTDYDSSFAAGEPYTESRQFVGYAGLNASLLGGRFRNRFAFAYTDVDRADYEPGATPERSFDGVGRNERFEYQGILDIADGYQASFGAETEKSRMRTLSIYDFPQVPTRHSARIDSFYGQLMASPLAGLTLTGGLRHDDHDRFGGATTFGSGLAYTPNGGATLLKASYSEGFKAPSLYQLYSNMGNSELQPETAKGWDAGIEQQLLGGRMTLGVTYFERRTRNQIDFVSCFGSSDPACASRPMGFYDNIARTGAEGVEATLNVRPFEALSIDAQYTYLDAENRAPGSPDFGKVLPRRPKHSASVRADYRWPFGLSTGLTVVHVSGSIDSPFNPVRLDDYTLTDLRASYPVAEHVELYGRVENLFDERYETAGGYGTLGRAAYVGARLAF